MEAPARTDAATPVPEEQLAALREEIRRAGGSVVRTQRSLRLLFWTPVGILAALVLVGFLLGWIPPSRWPEWLLPGWLHGVFSGAALWAIMVGLPMVMLAAPVLFTVPTIRRFFAGRRLAAHSRTVPAEELRSVFLPLVKESNAETRRLAARLLRDLNLPTELTPVRTPEGSGAEVSGAEARPD